MTLVLFLIVLTAVVSLVALPLLRPGEEALPLAAEGPAGPGAEVDRVLSALSEIEYDYEMNKLSQRDYEELKGRYSRQAIGLVQALEQAEAEAPAAEPYEAESYEAEQGHQAADPTRAEPELTAEDEAEAEIAALLDPHGEVKRS